MSNRTPEEVKRQIEQAHEISDGLHDHGLMHSRELIDKYMEGGDPAMSMAVAILTDLNTLCGWDLEDILPNETRDEARIRAQVAVVHLMNALEYYRELTQ